MRLYFKFSSYSEYFILRKDQNIYFFKSIFGFLGFLETWIAPEVSMDSSCLGERLLCFVHHKTSTSAWGVADDWIFQFWLNSSFKFQRTKTCTHGWLASFCFFFFFYFACLFLKYASSSQDPRKIFMELTWHHLTVFASIRGRLAWHS